LACIFSSTLDHFECECGCVHYTAQMPCLFIHSLDTSAHRKALFVLITQHTTHKLHYKQATDMSHNTHNNMQHTCSTIQTRVHTTATAMQSMLIAQSSVRRVRCTLLCPSARRSAQCVCVCVCVCDYDDYDGACVLE
jgi:hypothetical protein